MEISRKVAEKPVLYQVSLTATLGIGSWFRAPPPANPARIPTRIAREGRSQRGLVLHAARARVAAKILAVGLTTFVPAARAAVLEVGPGRAYATIAAAAAAVHDGDRVEIAPGEYLECAFWRANRLVIEGAGPDATIVSDVACGDKAQFVLLGADITVRNLTLSRVRVADGNGAGIRAEGAGVTVENVVFSNNQIGMLINPVPDGVVTIRDSQFIRNGACGRNCTGALGVAAAAALRVERTRFEGTRFGHQIAAQAGRVEILDCTITDGEAGTSSHLVDLVGVREVELRGNVLQKGLRSSNRRAAVWIRAVAGARIAVGHNSYRSDGPWRSDFVVNRSWASARLSGNALEGWVRPLVGPGAVE